MQDLYDAIATYRRTGFVVAYEHLRRVAANYNLTVQEALKLPPR